MTTPNPSRYDSHVLASTLDRWNRKVLNVLARSWAMQIATLTSVVGISDSCEMVDFYPKPDLKLVGDDGSW